MPVTALQRTLRRRLALAVRRERKKRGWTQEETSERAGLNPRHLQKLEAAELNVTLETLTRLCEAFGIDVRDLFDL
ncbi:MAG TPA: helix-turn-helix transcriptional regulator [Thermoanaerobaculia bacterium]|nr:helix-turn-helix transcriptional regulator [Thermoanaerobaculia bacterium]